MEAVGAIAAPVVGGVLGGKGGGDTTQTSSIQPYAPSQPHLNNILGAAQGLYDADPTGADIVAPFSADQNAGFGMTRDAVGGAGAILGQAQGSIGDVMAGGANPWQEATIDRALGQSQLMANQQARAMGRTGSPAAMQNATELGISAIAPIAMQGHQANIGNILSAAGMAPGIAQSQFMPAQQLLNIGGVQQAQDQLQRDAPYNALQRYSSQVLPVSGLGSSSSQTTPGVGAVQGALGGALMGGQLASNAGVNYGNIGSGLLGINPFGSY